MSLDHRPGLLASVRSLAEARLALAGEVDVIDLKEPSAGALGAVPLDVARDVAGLQPRPVVSATIGDVQLVLAPHLAGEPIGPKALGQLLDSVRRRDGSPPPGPLRPVVDRESGSGLDAVYRMRLELPQVESGALTLGRVDDDLIIGVAGMRRRVRLASVLRRCTVLDAALRGNELTVRFRPNPEVWPA